MILTPITASRFRADGGAMFGLVPKAIWSKRIPADARNTIAQNGTSILFQLPDGRKGIVDAGCGDPSDFSERYRILHGIPDEPWPLLGAIQDRGWTAEDIDFVVLTHLHWDHAGGVFKGTPRTPTFPNAVCFLHAEEWEDATRRDPLLHKAYPEELVCPLETLTEYQLRLCSGRETEILPGIFLEQSGGHTRGHCVVRFKHPDLHLQSLRGGSVALLSEQAVFMADACPTRHHFRLVFQPAYDTYPLDSRRWKQRRLPEYAADGTLVLFDHDPEVYGGILVQEGPDQFSLKEEIPIGS
jgi:glyoxylase-like metal-dependent hydrolase (beta-lactamase superfamily II)